jgi:hypothetical protein
LNRYSKRRMSVAAAGVSAMVLALLTTMSMPMPPKCAAGAWRAGDEEHLAVEGHGFPFCPGLFCAGDRGAVCRHLPFFRRCSASRNPEQNKHKPCESWHTDQKHTSSRHRGPAQFASRELRRGWG